MTDLLQDKVSSRCKDKDRISFAKPHSSIPLAFKLCKLEGYRLNETIFTCVTYSASSILTLKTKCSLSISVVCKRSIVSHHP